MPKTEFNIAIVGSGNMAHAMGKLFAKNHRIVQVVSRNVQSGKKLAAKLKCPFTNNIKDIYTQADFYLLCVPDDQITKVSKQLKQVKGILVHHSGAKPLSAIAEHKQRAVIYPLVSVNPDTVLDKKNTPVFFDCETRATAFLVNALLSGYAFALHVLKDEQRLKLHLAAVLVNNFTNHLYEKANEMSREIPGSQAALLALAQQALDNFKSGKTREKQTGPARRNDRSTMKKHLELIKKDREFADFYVSLSQSIYKIYHE